LGINQFLKLFFGNSPIPKHDFLEFTYSQSIIFTNEALSERIDTVKKHVRAVFLRSYMEFVTTNGKIEHGIFQKFARDRMIAEQTKLSASTFTPDVSM